MIEQNYNLDTIPFSSAVPVVHVSQYDSGSRTLKFKLLAGGSTYDMTGVTGAQINGKKPDGTEFSYNMTIVNDVVSIVITEQMAAVAGRVMAEVVLTGANSSVLGTANFIIEVEESPIDEGVISDTDVPIIMDFVTGGTPGQIFKRTATGGEWVNDTGGTASDVTYDNTDSGLTATNVQDAIDETVAELNTGLSSAVKSVNTETPDANGNVAIKAENIPAQGYGNESTSGNPITITDGTPSTVKNLDVSLEPIQDLHGYANPWPAGGGKNLFGGVYSDLFPLHFNTDTTITASADTRGGNGEIQVFYFDANGQRIDYWGLNQSGNRDYKTFEYPNTAYYIAFRRTESTNYQVEVGSTMTDYEPYSNICPISGYDSVSVQRTGHNIWDEQWELGGISEHTGQNTSDTDRFRSVNYILVKPDTIYYFNDTDNHRIFYYDSSKNFLSATSVYGYADLFVTPSNCTYIRFFSVGTTYNNDISINYPSTFTEYEPYSGSTATISLTSAGTVYGGTLDFDTGVLTVDRAMVDLGTLNWVRDANREGRFYTNSLRTTIKSEGKGACSALRHRNTGVSTAEDNIVSFTPSYGTGYIFAICKLYSDASSFVTAMTGQTLVYEFATPIEITLTPAQLTLIKDYNYITSNGTTISLDYYGSEATNVQAEIDEFETSIDRLTGSIAQIEESPATATHAVDALIVWNSQLYKVISAIAVGESLGVGTNLASTSVGDEVSESKIVVKTITGTSNANGGCYIANSDIGLSDDYTCIAVKGIGLCLHNIYSGGVYVVLANNVGTDLVTRPNVTFSGYGYYVKA